MINNTVTWDLGGMAWIRDKIIFTLLDKQVLDGSHPGFSQSSAISSRILGFFPIKKIST
jgi:hypothetical protein